MNRLYPFLSFLPSCLIFTVILIVGNANFSLVVNPGSHDASTVWSIHCAISHTVLLVGFFPTQFFCLSCYFFTRNSRMFRASLSSSGRLSVCPSVCLSDTLVICIKTVQARITKSSPWAAPRSLGTKFRATGCRDSPRTRASKRGTP